MPRKDAFNGEAVLAQLKRDRTIDRASHNKFDIFCKEGTVRIHDGRLTHQDLQGNGTTWEFDKAVWHYYEEGADSWQGTWTPIATIAGGYRYWALYLKRRADGSYEEATAQLDLVFQLGTENFTITRTLSGNDGGTYIGAVGNVEAIGSFNVLQVTGVGGYRQDPTVQWKAKILPTG